MRTLRKVALKLHSSLTDSTPPVYGDGNKVINHPKLENAKIKFSGKNNILYCETTDITLRDCKISFSGNNSVVYLSSHQSRKRKHHINIYIQGNSALYIGRNVNFHQSSTHRTDFSISEGKNIIIGNDCLFSLNIWFRTSDGHAVYDSNTKKRINNEKSILIGDHVWVGQDVSILKGSQIGSGSIIGAGSIVAGKALASNTSYAGSPAKAIRSGVFFMKPNINGYSGEELKKIETEKTNEWIYEQDNKALSFDVIDKKLSEANTSKEKLAYIKKTLVEAQNKNRFYIA